MNKQKYSLYRKMSIEEAHSVMKSSKLSIVKKDNLCSLKCFSESLIVPYRLNPFVISTDSQILKINLSKNFRNYLFQNCIKTKPFYADKTYKQYEKFNGQSIYYNCHGKGLDLYNFEINDNVLDDLNNEIIDIENLNCSDYKQILINEYFKSNFEDLITTQDLEDREFYIQLPFDLATLALYYQRIPRGGINKRIKYRFISKDLDLLDRLNLTSFPVTLAIKLNNCPSQNKLKSTLITKDTYAIDSHLIANLNNFISNIRLVQYIPSLNEHKLSSNVRKK